MRIRIFKWAIFGLLLGAVASGVALGAAERSEAEMGAWLSALQPFGAHFEENAGQLPPLALYAFRGQGYRFDLKKNGIAMATEPGTPHPMRIEFAGCESDVVASGRLPLAFRVQHPMAPERASQGIVSAQAYEGVRMDGMYEGIDVDYQVQDGKLRYDFIVAPGANPDLIALRFQGVSDVQLDDDGNLVVDLGNGMVHQHKPFLYQIVEGARKQVDGEYVRLAANEIGIRVGVYDAALPLIIDPVLTVIMEDGD